MKLVIVTAVAEYHEAVLDLFKKSGIETFSSSDIDGYKEKSSLLATQSWFPSMKGGNDSHMYFSFTNAALISSLLKEIRKKNADFAAENPIRAIVLPIEEYV